MDALFSEVLQFIAKALIVYLLARSAQASPATSARTRIVKKTAVVQKTIAPQPPARRVPAPPKKVVE